MSAKEGLYAIVSVGNAGALALLTGVDLSWSQDSKRFFPMGSIVPVSVLKGPISWDGSFRRAFTVTGLMGTFALGTYLAAGTIFPRGGTNPLVVGTFAFTGGALSNMSAESINAVEEENRFVLYGVTLTD